MPRPAGPGRKTSEVIRHDPLHRAPDTQGRGMTGTVFLAMLPAAIGFALSPLGLVEMILVLLSKRARINSLVFLAAIVVPVFAVPFLGASGMDAGTTTAAERGTAEGVVLLVIALILAALAARNFTRRHDTSAPAILDKIADMGPLAVLLLAPGMTVLNPKNLVVLLGAGSAAGRYNPSAGTLALAVGLFTLVAALPLLTATGYMQFGGPAASARLAGWRTWLVRNNRLIMTWVLGVLALALGAQAVAALL